VSVRIVGGKRGGHGPGRRTHDCCCVPAAGGHLFAVPAMASRPGWPASPGKADARGSARFTGLLRASGNRPAVYGGFVAAR
jgi:hypothetical protein